MNFKPETLNLKPFFDVLILDDDLFSLEVYSEILRKAGYRVSAFGTVAEAIEAFRGNPAGVVLLDLFLGDENGIKILPRFMEISPDTSVLIITANASLDTAVEGLRFYRERRKVKVGDLRRYASGWHGRYGLLASKTQRCVKRAWCAVPSAPRCSTG
jgi:CheY-like chemotaxis protein